MTEIKKKPGRSGSINPGDTVTIGLTIPGHINQAMVKFQNEEEAKTLTRPSKQAVITRALAEFFATRIVPAVLMITATGCDRGDAGTVFRVVLLFAGCAAIGHIVFMLKHGKQNKKN